ncbi:MAG: hypothetical protein K0R67_3641, partial [Paenibacillus sp.]|nr:hypothetical protein [Paenibacillus sp.]
MNQEIMRPINRKMNTLTKYVVSVLTAFTLFVVGAAATKAYTDTSNMTDAVFFSKINLDYPGLGTVKTHVANGNYTSAKASLLTYFQNRTSPVYFAMGTTPVTAPLRSTADELVNYEFHFTDGQSQTFTGGINWNYHWNPAQPTAFGGPHYYVMDFMMNSVLAPSYNALSVSDPKRAIYADTWMDFSLDYIADVGNLLTFSTGNNQL